MTNESRSRRSRLRRGQRRRAITLLEMVAATSVLLVIGVSAASILGKVSEVGARTNQAQQVRSSVDRLASVFRDDIRQADEIRIDAADALIEISAGDRLTRFRWDEAASDVTRESTDQDGRTHFERFAVLPTIRPNCSQADGIVTLNLVDAGLVHPWSIEARQR